jgi:NAD(P)-dependent dehydrogenase (short-subunit alcohol dehydrogenase family)
MPFESRRARGLKVHVDDVSGNVCVADGTGRGELVAAVAAAWGGRLDCLVNHAGTNVRNTVLDATEVGRCRLTQSNLVLKALGTMHLQLQCDEPLYNFAFNSNLRRYTEEEYSRIMVQPSSCVYSTAEP